MKKLKILAITIAIIFSVIYAFNLEYFIKGVRVVYLNGQTTVSIDDLKYFGNKLKNYKNIENIKEKFDLILITNNNKYWKKIGLKAIENKLNKNGIIFDFWNSFNDYKNKKYFSIGSGKLDKS